MDYKERNKTAPICRWHGCLFTARISSNLQKIFQVSEFSKVSGYQISTRKSIIFLYNSNKLVNAKINNYNTNYTYLTNYLGASLIKYVQNSTE